MQAVKAGEGAGFQKLHRGREITMRGGDATRKKEALTDAHVLVAANPVQKGGLVLDDAGREMRHHIKAFGPDALGGGDHLFDGGAFDMGDVDAGAFRQDRAEVFHLFGGAGHHLDRIAVEEGLKRLGFGFGFLATEIEEGHGMLLCDAVRPWPNLRRRSRS
jgi:hypothetical protein